MKQVEWGQRIASILAALILLGGAACVTSAEDLSRIVVFRDETSQKTQQDAIQRSGSRVLNILPLINGLAIELSADQAAQALQSLQAEPSVEGVYADPAIAAQGQATVSAEGAGGDGAGGDGAGGDLVIYIQPVPAPAHEDYEWGLKQIGVKEVHEDEPGLDGNGVKVAILDTGIDPKHPDLKQNLIGGVNARAGESQGDYQDYNGHGTHIAGIIAARLNKSGVIGAAPKVKIYAVKVLDANGGGKASDLVSGLGWVRANKINLVNMSLGFPQEWGPYPFLDLAIQRLADAGVIMVAAAGNTNPRPVPIAQGAGGDGAGGDTPSACSTASAVPPDEGTAQGAGGDGAGGDATTYCYKTTKVKFPAAYPTVIAVGATDEDGIVTGYSRSGPEMAEHGVVAPGGSTSGTPILSTNKGGGYGEGIGTSQATAHVTGALALALQLDPKLSFKDILALLQRTARSDALPAEWEGVGVIDVERMVETLKSTHQEDDQGKNEKN